MCYQEATVGIALLCGPPESLGCMTSFLSKSDQDRIAQFIATPQHERDPEMLIPSEEE